jgi:hypothetical protein
MTYDWEDDEQAATHSSRVAVAIEKIQRLFRATVSYALFAGSLAAFWTLGQSWLGLGGPDLVWWTSIIDPIAAPTERNGQFVNATPIIVGCVTAAIAIKLR